MAEVRMVSWNVQVYGAKKWGRSVNGALLVELIAQLMETERPNLVVTMELMSSVAEGISFNLTQALERVTRAPWTYASIPARANGDREAYGFHWRTDANFQPLGPPTLSAQIFPNNFSLSHGRVAARMTFETQDTGQLFTAMVYHAPANAFAAAAPEPIAKTIELYTVAGRPVAGCLIAGDFNIDVNKQPEFTWLTNRLPARPPPAPGEGAGCSYAVRRDTHLISLEEAQRRWPREEQWGKASTDYRSMLSIDNIFFRPFAGGASAIIDVLNLVATDRPTQTLIGQFDLDGGEAFPNARFFSNLLPWTLAEMRFAYLFTRYAISDHLPVFRSVTV